MLKKVKRLFTEETGISSVEYALLLAFIGIGIVAGATLLGTNVAGRITDAANAVGAGGS